MSRPLKGIRILDLSWVLSGPYTTMVLNDLGAEIIKVEKPGTGDIARGNGPFIDGVSSYFLSLNRGKRSITLDLASGVGKEIFLKLVEKADVVVENFVPGTMSRLGLGYDVLRKRNPRIIYAAISGFGQTGPEAEKPALDVTIQARGGIMSLTGEPGGPPIRPGVSFGDIIAGLFACVGILSALIERDKSGEGQLVDISMLDCQLAVLENALERYFATGEIPRALGTRHPIFTPFQVFETKDDYIALAITGQQWPLFCATINHIELIDDPRFETGELRTKNYALLEPILTEAIKTQTTQEWLEEFEKVEIPCSPVNTVDKVATDPQALAREMIVEIFQPKVGKVKVINTPVKLSRTVCRVEGVCPELGEHTEEVLTSLLGISQAELKQLREQKVI